MKILTTISLLFLFLIQAYCQTECNSFHRRTCGTKEGQVMRYDSQSKSAAMAKGQTSEFHMVAYGGLDYRITVCAEEMLGTEIQFKIYQKNRVLVKADNESAETENSNSSNQDDTYSDNSYSDDSYSDDSYSDDSYGNDSYSDESSSSSNKPKFRIEKELIYDNEENSYLGSLEFTSDGTNSLIIEIIIPGDKSSSKLKILEMGCVGVLIEHSKSKKTGF